MKPTSKFALDSKRKLEAIKKERNITEDWAADSQEYIKGWVLFLMHRKQLLQGSASQCLINISLVKHLIKKLLSRRGDVSKLTKAKKKEYDRLDDEAKNLAAACKKIVDAMEKVESPSDDLERSKQEAVAILTLVKQGNDEVDVQELKNKILQGEFPWLGVCVSGESSLERYRLPLHMAIWEYRRAVEEMSLVEAEVQGLIVQLGKRIDAIGGAVEQHKQKISSHEALPQERAVRSGEHLNQDANIGDLQMEAENLQRMPRSGDEHTIMDDREMRQGGTGMAIDIDPPQHPDSMVLDDPSINLGMNSDEAGGIGSSGRVSDWPAYLSAAEVKERWLEMCLKQLKAREVTEAESSISFLKNLMDEMHRLRGAATGILTQISSNTAPDEDEIEQQAEVLIEELFDREQARGSSNDEEDL